MAVVDCRRRELKARLVLGGMGTGNDFGAIVIWNRGDARCRIAGTVTFDAHYADGARDAKATINRPPRSVDVVLPGHMHAYHDGGDSAGYLLAFVMGPERDDPAQSDGLCRQQDELTPAVLVLGLGGVSLRVPNMDRESAPAGGVYGCHGSLLLEKVRRQR